MSTDADAIVLKFESYNVVVRTIFGFSAKRVQQVSFSLRTSLRDFLLNFGIGAQWKGFRHLRSKFRGLVKFIRDWLEFAKIQNPDFEITRTYLCLLDYESESGTARGDYFHQDLLVAQQVYESQPSNHLDIASRVDGFVAHVASFREIFVADIRPLASRVKNIRFFQMDLMNPDSVREFEHTFESISCLHAIEHFGLGRYGDSINPNGHLEALKNIKTMLIPSKCTLYLSFPMGVQRIEFHAHRIFSVDYAKKWLADEGFAIERFSYVDRAGELHRDVSLDGSAADLDTYRSGWGCGIFTLRC